MKTYRVNVKEVHKQPVIVQANDVREAVSKVRDGDGLYQETTCMQTLDSEDWTVEEVEIMVKDTENETN